MYTDRPTQKKTTVFSFNGFRLWEAKMGRISEETRAKKTKIKPLATPVPPHPLFSMLRGRLVLHAEWVEGEAKMGRPFTATLKSGGCGGPVFLQFTFALYFLRSLLTLLSKKLLVPCLLPTDGTCEDCVSS